MSQQHPPLTSRCNNSNKEFIVTIPDINSADLKEIDQSVKLMIWDTPGEIKHAESIKSMLKLAHVIVLVFDENQPETFANLEKHWMPLVNEYAIESITKVMF